MANNIVDQAKVAVALDGRDAETVLGELTAKTEKYTDALTKAFQAGDKVGMKNALKDLKETERQMAAVQKQTFDVTKVMKNLNGTSLKNLQAAERELNAELSKMNRGTQDYINKSKDLQKVSAEIRKVKTEMSGVSTQSGGLAGQFKQLLPALGTTAIIGGVISLGKAMFQTRSEFQKYEAILKNTLGSETASRQAMAMLTDTASKLPISLKEATESFIKMANRGMVPTQEEMRKLTDVAMSQGKSLDMFVEAMLDAQTGEFERLKEFGVRAKSEGDKVTFTFKGQTQTVQKTDEAIKAYLLSLGDMEGVSGSSAAVMGTLEGKVSNLGDAWDNMLNNMGKNTQGVLNTALGWLTDFVTNVGIAFMSVAQIKQQVMDEQDLSNYQNAMQEIKVSTDLFVKDGMKQKEAEAKAADLYAKSMQNSIDIAKQDLETATGAQKEKLEKRIASYEKELEAVNNHYKKMAEVELKGLKLTDTQKEDAYKKALTALENSQKLELIAIKNRYINGQLTADTYNQAITNHELINLEQRKALLTAWGKDTSDIESKIADDKIKKIEEDGKKEIETRKKIKEDIDKLATEVINSIDSDIEISTKAALESVEEDIDSELERRKELIDIARQYSADARDAEMIAQLAIIDQTHADGLLKEQEYQAALADIWSQSLNEKIGRYQSFISTIGDAISGFKEMEIGEVRNESEKELADLEEKHNRKAISDEVYNQKKQSIEEKAKKKEQEIRKKYAAKELMINTASIIASTALAAINAYANAIKIPIAGLVLAPIAAAAAVAAGVAQQAIAIQQYQKVMQAEKGRYNVIGADDGKLYTDVPFGGEMRTGLVRNQVLLAEGNRPEMVIDNPTLRNIQFNAPDIIPRIMAHRVNQRADGNYPAQSSSSQSQENDLLIMTVSALGQTINRLSAKLDNLQAYVVMDQFEKVKYDYDSLKNDVAKT
jgi:hypothetical protein